MAQKGRLKVQCFKNGTYIPIEGGKAILVPSPGQQGESKEVTLTTNSSGESQIIELDAPPLEYSQQPTGQVPYTLYDLRVDRDGFETLVIKGIQIYPEELAIFCLIL